MSLIFRKHFALVCAGALMISAGSVQAVAPYVDIFPQLTGGVVACIGAILIVEQIGQLEEKLNEVQA